MKIVDEERKGNNITFNGIYTIKHKTILKDNSELTNFSNKYSYSFNFSLDKLMHEYSLSN